MMPLTVRILEDTGLRLQMLGPFSKQKSNSVVVASLFNIINPLSLLLQLLVSQLLMGAIN